MLRTVDELEQRGLVERRPVPGDRRARIIALTADGQECLTAAEHVARETAGELFGTMDHDELTTLRDTLARFVNRHREPAAGGEPAAGPASAASWGPSGIEAP